MSQYHLNKVELSKHIVGQLNIQWDTMIIIHGTICMCMCMRMFVCVVCVCVWGGWIFIDVIFRKPLLGEYRFRMISVKPFGQEDLIRRNFKILKINLVTEHVGKSC